MKRICLILALILLLGCLAACGESKPAADASKPQETKAAPKESTELPPETAPASAKAKGEYVEDFTVKTIDGGTFTLSEALKDHEIVLINLFFSGCGPCGMEFPFMQEAWTEYSDRVAVIALSVDPSDTDEVLRDYQKELGLTLPMGHEEGTGLAERFVSIGYPTTLLVDKNGRVAMLECGAMSSKEEFVQMFEQYTGENYNPKRCTYTVYCYDVDGGADVNGVVVNFCTDTACTPVTSADQGAAIFTGAPEQYHVQIVKVPEGWKLVDEAEWTTHLYDEIFWIGFEASGE